MIINTGHKNVLRRLVRNEILLYRPDRRKPVYIWQKSNQHVKSSMVDPLVHWGLVYRPHQRLGSFVMVKLSLTDEGFEVVYPGRRRSRG